MKKYISILFLFILNNAFTYCQQISFDGDSRFFLIHDPLEMNHTILYERSTSNNWKIDLNLSKSDILPDGLNFLALTSNGQLIKIDPSQKKIEIWLENISDFNIQGEIIATAGKNGSIYIISLESGTIVQEYQITKSPILSLSISPNKKHIISCSEDGYIRVLDYSIGKIIKKNLQPLGRMNHIIYGENGNEFIVHSNNALLHFNKGIGEKVESILLDDPLYTGKYLFNGIYVLTNSTLTYLIGKENKRGFIFNYEGFILNKCGNYVSELTIQKDTIHVRLFEMESIKTMFDSYSKYYNNGWYLNANDSLQIALTKLTKEITITPSFSLLKVLNKTDLQENGLPWSSDKSTSDQIRLLTQFGFAAPLKEMFFTADGKKIITIAESPIIQIWNKSKHSLIDEIRLPEFSVMHAAIHPHWPLLAVIDRNFKLYLIDIDQGKIISAKKITDFKYEYYSDADITSETDLDLHFTADGSILTLKNTNEYNQYSYGDDEYSIQFNFPTRESLKGVYKNIQCEEKIMDAFPNEIQSERQLYQFESDTLFGTILKGEGRSLNKCTEDSSRLCFYHIDYPEKYFIAEDSTYYLDKNHTIPLPLVVGDLPEYIYVKYKKPEIRNWPIEILKRNHSGKFAIIYHTMNQKIELVDIEKNTTIQSMPDTSGVFIDDLHSLFVDSTGIFVLDENRFLSIEKLKSKLRHRIEFNKINPKQRYYLDKDHHKVSIWNNALDHGYIEYDFTTKEMNLRQIPKPNLGHAKTSLTHPECIINHGDHLSNTNFEKLDVTRYTVVDPESENPQLKILKPGDTTIMNDWKFKLYFGNNVFYNSSPMPNLDYYSYNHQFGFSLKNESKNIHKSYFVNLAEMTMKHYNCYRKPDCDPYYGSCISHCDLTFSILDTLIKNGQIYPRLTESERESFEDNISDLESIYEGTGRTHVKGNEFSYLSYYNLSPEYSDFQPNNQYAVLDSTLHVTIGMKYELQVRKIQSGKLLRQYNPPPVGSYQLHILPEKEQFLQFGFDGVVRVYDLHSRTNEPIVTFLSNRNGYIFLTSDNFYKISSKNIELIRFKKGQNTYDIEQFDLKYNRPDILLERIGNKDSLLISSYHAAYHKRLKKMGFTEEMLKDDFHLPEIQIKNFEHLPSITDSSDLNLDLNIKDTKYKLDRINIFINDVPVYGTGGIDLRKENTQNISKKMNLTLSEGENKIQVSVLNQAGAESYKETAYVTYKPKKSVQPNLYLVTIGDSKYSDSRYDLTYASKDATDIKNAFEKNANSLYGAVYTFNYVDAQVTKENILKLKSELLKAKRDDVVIITVAGHGVLDDKLDYYLATHDMDFSNPSEKGIPYEELESLLDGIAPLKKVLFLDACHSGEVDKEEVESLATNTTTNSKVKFRNAGAGIQKKNLGLKTTSELMSELFTDLRRGTGATVISSAGGAEYAMESDEWKNGLFTYCLLHGLKDKAADSNKDGQIMLSELQSYLRKEVTELSGGAQQPTSRIENLSMDFRVW